MGRRASPAYPVRPERADRKYGLMSIVRRQSIQAMAVLGALIGLITAASPASADDAATVSLAPPLALGSAAPVSDDVLGTETAKAQIEIDKLVINDQDLNGVVQGNSAINTQSGNNSVSGEAFQDTAGFVTVIQNTGNNVLIQNSTIVNVALEP